MLFLQFNGLRSSCALQWPVFISGGLTSQSCSANDIIMSLSIFDCIRTKTQSNAASPAEGNNCYQWMFTLRWQGIQWDSTSYSIKFISKATFNENTSTDSTTVWSLIKAGQINKGFSAEACKAQGQLQSGSDKVLSLCVCVCVCVCVMAHCCACVTLQSPHQPDSQIAVTKWTYFCIVVTCFYMWLWFTNDI